MKKPQLFTPASALPQRLPPIAPLNYASMKRNDRAPTRLPLNSPLQAKVVSTLSGITSPGRSLHFPFAGAIQRAAQQVPAAATAPVWGGAANAAMLAQHREAERVAHLEAQAKAAQAAENARIARAQEFTPAPATLAARERHLAAGEKARQDAENKAVADARAGALAKRRHNPNAAQTVHLNNARAKGFIVAGDRIVDVTLYRYTGHGDVRPPDVGERSAIVDIVKSDGREYLLHLHDDGKERSRIEWVVT